LRCRGSAFFALVPDAASGTAAAATAATVVTAFLLLSVARTESGLFDDPSRY